MNGRASPAPAYVRSGVAEINADQEALLEDLFRSCLHHDSDDTASVPSIIDYLRSLPDGAALPEHELVSLRKMLDPDGHGVVAFDTYRKRMVSWIALQAGIYDATPRTPLSGTPSGSPDRPKTGASRVASFHSPVTATVYSSSPPASHRDLPTSTKRANLSSHGGASITGAAVSPGVPGRGLALDDLGEYANCFTPGTAGGRGANGRGRGVYAAGSSHATPSGTGFRGSPSDRGAAADFEAHLRKFRQENTQLNSEMQKQYEENARLASECEKLRREVRVERQARESVQQLRRENDELRTQLNAASTENKSLADTLRRRETDGLTVVDRERRMADQGLELVNLEARLAEASERAAENDVLRARLEAALTEADAARAEADEATADTGRLAKMVMTLNQKIEELHARLHEKEAAEQFSRSIGGDVDLRISDVVEEITRRENDGVTAALSVVDEISRDEEHMSFLEESAFANEGMLREVQERNRELQGAIERMTTERDAAQAKLRDFTRMQQELADSEKEAADLRREVTSLRVHSHELTIAHEQLRTLTAETHRQNARISGLDLEREHARAELDAARADSSALRRRLDESGSIVARLTQDAHELRQELHAASARSSQLAIATERLQTLERQQSSIAQSPSKSPLMKEVGDLRDELATRSRETARLEREVEALRVLEKDAGSLRAAVEGLRAENTSHVRYIAELEARLADAEHRAREAAVAADRAREHAATLTTASSDLAAAHAHEQDLLRQLSERHATSEALLSNAEDTIKRRDAEVEALSAEVQGLMRQLEAVQRDLRSTRDQLAGEMGLARAMEIEREARASSEAEARALRQQLAHAEDGQRQLAESQREAEDQKREAQRLSREATNLKQTVEDLQMELASVRESLRQSTIDAHASTEAVFGADADVAALQADLGDKQRKVLELSSQCELLKRSVDDYRRRALMEEEQSQALKESHDALVSRLKVKMEYLERETEAHERALAEKDVELSDAQASAASNEAALQSMQNECDAMRAAADQARDDLQASLARADQLDADLQSAIGRIEDLNAREKELTTELHELQPSRPTSTVPLSPGAFFAEDDALVRKMDYVRAELQKGISFFVAHEEEGGQKSIALDVLTHAFDAVNGVASQVFLQTRERSRVGQAAIARRVDTLVGQNCELETKLHETEAQAKRAIAERETLRGKLNDMNAHAAFTARSLVSVVRNLQESVVAPSVDRRRSAEQRLATVLDVVRVSCEDAVGKLAWDPSESPAAAEELGHGVYREGYYAGMRARVWGDLESLRQRLGTCEASLAVRVDGAGAAGAWRRGQAGRWLLPVLVLWLVAAVLAAVGAWAGENVDACHAPGTPLHFFFTRIVSLVDRPAVM